MARWRKLLQDMIQDTDPRNYEYDDVSLVLRHLGFEEAPHRGGSHRKWRFRGPDGLVVVVGFVTHGSGTLKPVYIRDMVGQLRKNRLIPPDME